MMVLRAGTNEKNFRNALNIALSRQDIVQIGGLIHLDSTLTLTGDNRPNGIWTAGVRIMAGGPMWDHPLGAEYFNWGGGGFRWQGPLGEPMLRGCMLYSELDGLVFFGANRAGEAVQLLYSAGWGTGKNRFSRCWFQDLDRGVSCGLQSTDGNCDLTILDSCFFTNVSACLNVRNWQGYGHTFNNCRFTNVGCVADVEYGGRVTVRDMYAANLETVFVVRNTTEQLDTYIIDGLTVDYGGEPPTLLDLRRNVCGQPLHLSVANVHTTKPNTVNPILFVSWPAYATLRNVRKVGRLCEGSSKATVVLDCCDVAEGAWPSCPVGWGSGLVRYNDGAYETVSWTPHPTS